jgi:dinuclear metal center YbgI/SA1388 family protein
MLVSDVTAGLEKIAPLRYAADWDNVGLLVGATDWRVSTAMLTVDLTASVLQEAIDAKVDMIGAYHPPIFKPLGRLTDDETASMIALRCARAGVAVHSSHTAIDAAPGGVNDWLAAGLGTGDVRSLETYASLPQTEQCKIVTFCPRDTVDALRQSLATMGAGRIGEYEQCSFEIEGRGTFLGGSGTSPAVGQRGGLERVDEVRLEMVCSTASLGLAVTAVRQFHPYEEPPVEIYQLQPRPDRSIGHGRRVVLDRKADLATLAERLKSSLGVSQLRVADAGRGGRKYQTIGLCAGAGGSLLSAAIDQGCELFLTGEMRHHDVLAARAAGCTVVLAGHTNTERGYLKTWRKQIAKELPDLKVSISRKDADPLRAV